MSLHAVKRPDVFIRVGRNIFRTPRGFAPREIVLSTDTARRKFKEAITAQRGRPI